MKKSPNRKGNLNKSSKKREIKVQRRKGEKQSKQKSDKIVPIEIGKSKLAEEKKVIPKIMM